MSEWINAKERLPRPEDYSNGFVIVAYEDGIVRNGFYSEGLKCWGFTETHGEALWWMPYPKHPEVKQNS